jgi:BCD family chlorophyll transporter-like MFS transporter
MKFLHLSLKALRLSLVRVGIGWMFALLAFNFNRISLVELGASGIIVTTLIGMHHFLSPFQVFWGRLADRFPLFGYRRTPYILLGALVGSLVFLTLPSLAIALGSRELWAIPVAAVLFLLFGLAMAANGTATFALITEVTTPTERGTIVAFTHTALVLSAIISAGIASQIMPVYSPEQMQFLYNLTPFIAVGSTLLGLIGMERRQTSSEQRSQLSQPAAHDLPENPFRAALNLLETNTQVRGFFLFMLLAIAGIFITHARNGAESCTQFLRWWYARASTDSRLNSAHAVPNRTSSGALAAAHTYHHP